MEGAVAEHTALHCVGWSDPRLTLDRDFIPRILAWLTPYALRSRMRMAGWPDGGSSGSAPSKSLVAIAHWLVIESTNGHYRLAAVLFGPRPCVKPDEARRSLMKPGEALPGHLPLRFAAFAAGTRCTGLPTSGQGVVATLVPRSAAAPPPHAIAHRSASASSGSFAGDT